MLTTPSTELYDKLIEADPCWYKVDNLYFSSCPRAIFSQKQEVIMHQGVQRTPGTHLGLLMEIKGLIIEQR